jgi:hypothetical protein
LLHADGSLSIAYNPGMKLQFSLATLLVCMTVLAALFALAVGLPVTDRKLITMPGGLPAGIPVENMIMKVIRQPTASEVLLRIALWGVPAVAAISMLLAAARSGWSGKMMGMKIGSGFLITLAIFGLLSITAEFARCLIQARGQLAFNWHDLFELLGYYGSFALMLTLGIIIWRRKPKNRLWYVPRVSNQILV